MSKEKAASGLGNFKISDAVKRPVSPNSASQLATSGGGGKKKGAQEEAPSAGFPNIERLIEADTLDKSGLAARREVLGALAKEGDNKGKAGARKALLAYDRVEELLDYLWSTKEKLATGGGAPAPAKKK